MTNLQPGQQLGPYQIINQIGKGGMATVYKAYHAATDRYVAIKVILNQLIESPDFIKRFQQEARMIARLEHPHILPLHDFGEADGIPYMVMRYLDAGTLKERIKDAPLSLAEVNRIFIQLADALQYAHENGVIHRDIKPSNVMLNQRGDVFLTDFGVAKMLEGNSGLTATGTVTGTPDYMSPEQAQGLKIDQRSDVYSLGIVLFEMLTGRVPFEAETPLAVLFKQIQEPPPPLSIVRPDLPYQFEPILLKALTKDPADRYASVAVFREMWTEGFANLSTAPEQIITPPPVAPVSDSAPAIRVHQPPTSSHTKSVPALPQTNIPPLPAPKKNGIPYLTVGLVLLLGGLCLTVLAVGGYLTYRSIFGASAGVATPTTEPALPTAVVQPTKEAAPTLLVPSGTVEEFFKVWSIRVVYNKATAPTTFTINHAWQVTEIMTYHWNDGRGVSSPGTIGLKAADGTMYGPWTAAGQAGQGGVPNVAWVVHPNIIIPPGDYTVIDSDPGTWSQNAETGGAGMAWGHGIRQDNP